tara:strand:+ start:842 stop:1384 length:543 start_codon:yes stop_codon:yes gene_type:complete
MSILKTNQITDLGGNELLTSNGSGVISSGGAITNTPAFRAYANGDQNVSDNTETKVSINAEDFDTNANFDSTTNYRFTPTVAGKYFVFAQLHFANSSSEEIHKTLATIKKNGSQLIKNTVDPHNGSKANVTANYLATTVDMNGSSDYLELFGQIDVGSGTPLFSGGSSKTWFGAYRIIGA